MTYLVAESETPSKGLSRAMQDQADKLLDECQKAKEHPASFAHKARVRVKKIRAALRLAEPMLGRKAWRKQNRWWRNAARELSDLRDAGARLEALDSLRPFLIARIGSAMTRKLTERFEKEQRAAEANAPIKTFRKRLKKRDDKLIPRLPAGKRSDIAEKLAESYRASRQAMKVALETGEPEMLHEWRKQAKSHALQARLVRQMFPETLEERHIAARDLAELLGAVQDIEIVFEGIANWAEGPEGLAEALQARRSELIEEARVAGEALFGAKTKAWAKLLARRKRKERKVVTAPKRASAPKAAPRKTRRSPPRPRPTPQPEPLPMAAEQPAPPNGIGHEIEMTVGNA